MASPTGIIPEGLMFREQKRAVLNFLKAQPLPGNLKRELLLGWAQWVGVRIQQREYRELDESGTDFQP